MNTHRPVYVVRAALFALLAITTLACLSAPAEGSTRTPTDQRCYSAAKWGPAPDSIRPCVKLRGNAPEAGAVRFKVFDASGVVRYTGFVNTRFHRIATVRVVRLYEDGSFRWQAVNYAGRVKSAGVDNLQD